QVGKAGPAPRLVLRADAVIERDADHRGLAVRMHQRGEAVGEREALVGNVHLLDERGQRRRLFRRRGSGGLRKRLGGGGRAGGEGQRKEGGSQETAHYGPRTRDSIAKSA